MNLKYNPVTKCLLVMIPLISANAAIGQESVALQDKTATVNGTRVHYRIGGKGPFLLLLHGFTLSSVQWEPFVDEFARQYTVIIPDLPRHGKSGPYQVSYAQWAGLMADLLKSLKIDRVRGIGHSAGAITLLYMARQYPGLLESMVLVSGAHRTSREGRSLLMEDSFEKADPAFREYYLSIHPGGLPQVNLVFKDLNEMARKYDVTGDHPMLSPEELGGIAVPALLVWGDRDPYFPVEIATALYESLPDAQLWVIPGQGHVSLWPDWGGESDAAEQFAAVSCRFLGNHYKPEQHLLAR